LLTVIELPVVALRAAAVELDRTAGLPQGPQMVAAGIA
jgi:hypothetical protein